MATTADAQRHAPLAVIEDYLERGVAGVIAVKGLPPGAVVVDARHHRLAVRTLGEGRRPDITDFENLRFDVIVEDGATWEQLTVRLADNTEEVYALLCAILDRVQVAGTPFAEAIEATIDSLTGLLALRHALTREKQLGLFGELLVLLALAQQLGPLDAMDTWRGPVREEHDFGLSELDLEVKTTLAERREHWISSATQLAPTGSRPLYLVSIQLTTAGLDGGWSLPSLVEHVRLVLPPRFPRFESLLAAVGYRDRDSELYRSRWTFRDQPLCYHIDPDFPALTQERLNMAVPAAERIRQIQYRVDLTDMRPTGSILPLDYLAGLATSPRNYREVDHER